MPIAINVQDICFKYKGQDKNSLSNISLSIEEGERFGIFGPNGAGKTTFMKLMTGLLPYQEGKIELLNKEVQQFSKEAKQYFGFVPQDLSFYEDLSPVENLAFFGAWSGLKKVDIQNRTGTLLEVLGLSHVKDRPVKTFSGGMKRRVNLAIGVIHQPRILILDEPTVGVDVQTRHAIIQYLHQLNEEGMTLVYTSHQLKEAEDLCTQIAMIDEGEIIAIGTLQDLLIKYDTQNLESLFLQLTGKAYRDE